MLRCIFCGLCEEACPKDAIYLTETFAPANYTRKSFIYGKPDLLIPNPVDEPAGFEKAKGLIEERKANMRNNKTE
jgi:NADH-quinone oxidoreductase subunit I